MFDVLMHFEGSGWARDGIGILVGSSLRITLLLLVAAGAAVALRRASAARRHLVWTVAVVGALAMPFLSSAMPELGVPIPRLAYLELGLAERPGGTADEVEGSAIPGGAVSVAAASTTPEAPATRVSRGAPEPAWAAAPDPRETDAEPAEARAGASSPAPEGRDDAIVEEAYEAVGIGEAERTDGLRILADELDLRTRAVETRVDGLERRVAALEALEALSDPPGSTTPDPGRAVPLPQDTGERPRIASAVVPGGDAGDGGGAAGAALPGSPLSLGDLGGLGLAGTLLGLWAVGFLAVTGALLLGTLRLARIRRRSAPIETGPVVAAADRVARRLGLARRPLLLQGDDTAMPMTWGLSRTFVLLPAGAEDWEAWRLEAVLLHEFAHVVRRDYLAQLAAHVACALYWFHPLVWIASHRLRVEREHACDDVVVSAGTDPSRYAGGLLEIARTLRGGRSLAGAGLAMARPTQLRARLLALVDDGRDRRPLGARRVAAVWGLGLALALPLAGLVPTTGRAAAAAEGATPAPEPPAAKIGEALAGAGENPALMGIAGSAEALLSEPAGTLDLGAAWADAMDPVVVSALSPARESGLELRAVPEVSRSVRLLRAQEATALCGPADGEMERSSHMRDDDLMVIETQFGGCTTSVRIEGDVRFGDDLQSITGLSSDGFLRLEVARDGERRRMEIRPGAGGRPEVRWWVDGQERPVDETAERWLEVALVDLFRTTGFKAEERVALILEREGPEGVLAEVGRMRVDHARARYLQLLLERGRLSGEQVRRVIELGGREIDSDHWVAAILTAAAERYDFDPATRTAFIQAAGSIDSDHHQASVLGTALARDDLSREDLEALLAQVADGIESDHHAAGLLTQLSERYALEPELREPFLRAAATLESDHHRASVYGTLLARRNLRSAELAAVLEQASRIESDHHLAGLLVQVAEHDLSDPTLRRAFLSTARSVESSHHRTTVLEAALGLGDLSGEDMAAILAAAGEIESDHHVAALLSRVPAGRLADATMQRAYLEAAAEIDSDHHLATALGGLVERGELGSAELVLLLRAARSIGSDHHLSGLLVDVASRHPIEGEARDEMMRALATIESEHHHGRVSSRLVGGS